jgi:uncharacterized protein (TIGR02145 family)
MKSFYSIFLILLLYINFTYSQTTLDTIEVKTGWNMIGALVSGNTIEIISTIPTGIISASIYGYNPDSGYEVADTLHKGKGYWVKVTQNGNIIIGLSTPFVCGDVVLYGGETYHTVSIGSQCWFQENLNVGTRINGSGNQTNNSIIEKYCYSDLGANCTTYGGLYQWNEAMQYVTTQGTKGICPTGWHIPTQTEQQTLATAVSNDGNSLKAIGQGTGSGVGTNTSGFSALLAGASYGDGYFYNIGGSTYFWSSTETNATYAYDLYLGGNVSDIKLYYDSKGYGFSVRCLKD